VTFVEFDIPDADPGSPADPTGVGEWHRQVVAVVFDYCLEVAGLVKGRAQWWSEERCDRCDCCSPSGGGCWYCGEVAA
jgi:hypothetical protein